jgi:hypothetical protein
MISPRISITPMLGPNFSGPRGTKIVGTPDYPSGIPDMHTIHDPMISVSWIHISELITELHHPLPYRINILTIGHMTKHDIAMQGKSTTKQRIPSSVDDPRNAYYPTGNWLGDILVRTGAIVPSPSSSNSCSRSDQVNSQGQSHEYILNCTRKPSKGRVNWNAVWL